MRKLLKKIKYLFWRLCNPSKRFHDYYVLEVQKKIERSGSHETLCTNARNPERYSKTAELEVAFLREFGLSKEHRVVDYGCGSLRLGQKLISWLDSGNYIGLDVTDQFFKDGLSALSDGERDSVAGKVEVISEETILRFSQTPSDYLISTAVFYHIPRSEMHRFFSMLLSLLKPGGQAFIDFSIGDEYVKTGNMTWQIPEWLIREELKRFDVSTQIIKPERLLQTSYYTDNHRIIRIVKNENGKPVVSA